MQLKENNPLQGGKNEPALGQAASRHHPWRIIFLKSPVFYSVHDTSSALDKYVRSYTLLLL